MLSDTRIRALKPGTKDRWISDGHQLYLRLRATGGRSWVLRRKTGNLTLGSWPEMSLGAARIEAAKNLGKNLRDRTLGEVLEEWFADVVAKRYRRPHHVEGYFDRMEPALKATKLRNLQRAEVRASLKRFADKRGPVTANRLLSILKTALSFARDAGYIEVSPLEGMSPEIVGGIEPPCTRVLTDDEICMLMTSSSPHAPLLRFLLLTGQRIGEAQRATWAHIHGDRWLIPAEHAKNHRAHWVALSHQALRLLGQLDSERELIFGTATNTGVQAWLRRWCEREQITPAFTPHDLRRTAATRLNSLGVAPHVVEKILNHTLQGMQAVYNQADYAPERVTAMQLWADELDRLIGVRAIKTAA
jgi:integrase